MVTHFGLTEKPTRDCMLLYWPNNVGFRVGNVKVKVHIFVK